MRTITDAAFLKSAMRSVCVARIVPLPGSAMPSASLRQFMEFAVNMPEQEPQVGQAESSMDCSSAAFSSEFAPATIAVTKSVRPVPASIAPPDIKMVGMLSRMAAMSMPGVILSQLLMQKSASTQ